MKRRLLLLCLLLGFAVQWVMAAPPQPASFRVKQLDYGGVRDLAWSPDGQTLAVATQKGVFLLNADYEEIATLPGEIAQWRTITWNYDGTRLAVTNMIFAPVRCYTSVWWGSESEQRLPVCGDKIWGNHTNWLGIVDWYRDNRIALWNLEDGALEPRIFSPAHDAAFSPDDRLLAFASTGNHLTIWNLETQMIEREIPAGGTSVSWSPDGGMLLTTVAIGEKIVSESYSVGKFFYDRAFNAIYIWNTQEWDMPEVIEVQQDRLTVKEAFWLDEQHILAACSSYSDFGSELVCLWNQTTDTMLGTAQLSTGSDYGYLDTLSPDKRYFSAWLNQASLDRTLRVGQLISAGQTEHTLLLPGIAAAWSPDSQFITAVDGDGWLYEYRIAELDFAGG